MEKPPTICHVKGCGQEAVAGEYFPALGCLLGFCSEHSKTPEALRVDWIIDLVRAREEHKAGFSAMRKSLNIPE